MLDACSFGSGLPFDGCWQRVERARTHAEAIEAEWRAFIEDGGYTVTIEIEPDGEGTVTVEQVKPSPADLPLYLGELLYNLRAALDGCLYETAILDSRQNPPPHQEQIEFPIVDTVDHFKSSAWKIAALSEKHRRWVEEEQPYRASIYRDRPELNHVWDGLWLLHDLARRDRHRHLHVMGAMGSNRFPRLMLPEAAWFRYIETDAGPIEHKRVVALFGIEGWEPTMTVEYQPDLAVEPDVIEGNTLSVLNGMGLRNRLYAMIGRVHNIVHLFASDFGFPTPDPRGWFQRRAHDADS